MAAKATDKFGGLDVFYPIVPDVAWLERLVPLGVKTVQLRLKDASPDRIRREIGESLEVCARHGCQLIVNDYWREALALGADYIHLGQEDLADADVPTIQAKGARLGISTHSEAELAIALAAAPSYVALGPIYETRLKVMKWAPQGLERVGRLEEADRHSAFGRDRRHHAREGRRRAGGGCRQPGCDHGLLHPCRPRGPRARMAGLGGALQGLKGRQGRPRVADYLRWIVTVANV